MKWPPSMGVVCALVLLGCGEVTTDLALIDDGGQTEESGTGGEGAVDDDEVLEDCWRQAAQSCGWCHCEPDGFLSCSLLVVEPYCNYGGLLVVAETSLPSLEDCNTCTCQHVGPCPQDAEMRCAAADCTTGCSYAGRHYPEGVWFPATDGCNDCTCSEGEPRCGSADCACDPEREHWREYTVAPANDCASLDIDCPAGSVRFANDCGCGCEQSPECPAEAGCEQNRPDTGLRDARPAYARCEAVFVCPLTRGVRLK